MTTIMRNRFWGILAAVFLVLAAGPAAALAEPTMTVNVDCTAGETIAKALTLGDERKPMLVVVKGTCNDSVSIERSDVTLQGDPFVGGGVNGPDPSVDTLRVTGSRVTVDGLTVTGGRNGITGFSAAGLRVRNTTVQLSGRNGITFTSGASGVVDGCTIQLNPRDGVVIDAAQATVVNSSVSQNARFGVLVTNGGSARLGVDNVGTGAGNTISLNGSNGVIVSLGSSAFIAMNQITGNGADPAANGRTGGSGSNAAADLIRGDTRQA